MARNSLKTPEQIKAELKANGITARQWAETHGFPPRLVYQVLNGSAKGYYGLSHHCAIALGMKTATTID
ncbi:MULTISPECIES: DNA-binding protein [Yersinia pseudotuberculosis complex]|uniref:DNA-binding protein n=1 Tax=Yersinia pseudotuberculosis complex TaxID=1649845 RepID=UPI0005E7726C|nr:MULTISPECIES: DNA-binding protein [Yersinia pseudotuberculosis complex]MBO1548745.1 DNA-binding protein [Yersinia pseudotuberculosis]MBO1554579.1 DNA-binding protein [Yersinia pseudotuberculosis]MBO1568976.1 DNA-binding protein [Yersinia pseudotuberculosis]MBO1583707.1 DNA-binding protein [Yersinia pseudotuberculosis]MBO1633664.1 DNA-binding protein [Yersinia pseudotuberculosis]